MADVKLVKDDGSQTKSGAVRQGLTAAVCLVVAIVMRPLYQLLRIRFLSVLTTRIGHLCVEPDCYLKEEVLGLRPEFAGTTVVLASRRRVANCHLLRCWQPRLKIMVVPHWLYALLKPFSNNPFFMYDVSKYCAVIEGGAYAFRLQREWAGRPPLLTLADQDRKRGRERLRELGLPDDAWFVCVHCREEGYAAGEGQTYRNASIENYLLAMQAVVDHGGWVVRVGDAGMQPLPEMECVVDYARLGKEDERLDVFLAASCRFFLGGASGLVEVAHLFGVPGLQVNQAPMSVVLPFAPSSLGIPKLLRSVAENRRLTFREVFESPVSHFRFDSQYAAAGVKPEENSPEDIRDAVLEMLDRTEGKAVYPDTDEELQERFKALMKPDHYSYGAASRVGRDFLRKYAHLLD